MEYSHPIFTFLIVINRKQNVINGKIMRIKASETIGAVIDVQERLFPHIHQKDDLAGAIKKMIDGFKVLEVPLILTQQYTKGLGNTIPDIAQELPEMDYIEKKRFSCCGVSQFDDMLGNAPYRNVVLMGIETHVCVLQTAIDLVEQGYQPIVVADAVSSREYEDHEIALRRLQQEGVLLTTVESLLFELTVEAGSEEFKKISRIVK